MSEDSPEIISARAEVERSRHRLASTFDELQRQFAPHAIMREAWESAREKSAELAENAVDAVRRRPYTAAGVVAGLALFIAREPLMGLAGKLTQKVGRKTARKSKTKSTEKAE